MGLIPPYLPSINWMRGNLKEAHLNRCLLCAETTLTIPIEGGRQLMKRLSAEEWQISGHGNWRHVHLNTIDTLFGKMPYHCHYISDLRSILHRHADGSSFKELTIDIYEWICESLEINKLNELLRKEAEKNETISKYRDEICKNADMSQSILSQMMLLGKDAIFLLI